jgi:hypothetical protein
VRRFIGWHHLRFIYFICVYNMYIFIFLAVDVVKNNPENGKLACYQKSLRGKIALHICQWLILVLLVIHFKLHWVCIITRLHLNDEWETIGREVIVERHALLSQNAPELTDKSLRHNICYREANPGPPAYQQEYWPLCHDFGWHVIQMRRFHDARMRI